MGEDWNREGEPRPTAAKLSETSKVCPGYRAKDCTKVPTATSQLQMFTVTSYTFLVHSVTEKYDSLLS